MGVYSFITPKNSNNDLIVEVQGCFGLSASTNATAIMCLFKNSDADAITAVVGPCGLSSTARPAPALSVKKVIVAGGVGSITFKMRAGLQTGTINFNGSGGSALFNGTSNSYILITEVRG